MPAFLLNPTVILGIVCAVLLGVVHYERSERMVLQAQFDSFKDKTAALGEQQKAANAIKEKADEEKLNAAVASRDDAMRKLQLAQAAASASRRASSQNPAAPAGSRQVCFESAAYTAAFQQFGKQLDGFIQATRGLSVEGDVAAINAKSLIDSWPTPTQQAATSAQQRP